MSAIRGRDNKTTERRIRARLVQAGIRGWTLQPAGIFGRPDFFFPRCSVAVFIDGCFWHGCGQCGHYPKTRSAFWRAKINRNRERDRHKTEELQRAGFVVLRFWEHELNADMDLCIRRIVDAIARRS